MSSHTGSNNVPTVGLESLDALTAELASGSGNNDGFLSRSHFVLFFVFPKMKMEQVCFV